MPIAIAWTDRLHPQVASEIHSYAPLEGAAVTRERAVELPKSAFKAPAASASMNFKDVKTGGANPPWHSMGADRHPVPHADLELCSAALGTGVLFADALVSNIWLGAVADFRHQLALKEERTGQWFIALRHCPGSCAILWPAALHHMREQDGAYFVPMVQTHGPVLKAIGSLQGWQAARFEFRSPAWQHAKYQGVAGRSSVEAIRCFMVGEPKALLVCAAEAGFWSLPKSFLQGIATLIGVALTEGASAMDMVFLLCRSILGNEAQEEVTNVAQHRLVELTRLVEHCDANYAECEELDEVLEKNDEKVAEKQCKDHADDQAALQEARETFRTQVAASRGSSSRGASSSGSGKQPKILNSAGRRYPKNVPKGMITHEAAKSLRPPGSYVWRGLTDGKWCGRLPPFPEMSRSWAKYGEQQALRIVLVELWDLYLTGKGLGIEHCPIENLMTT